MTTPVNNGVFDLMHLIELFAQASNAFAGLGVHCCKATRTLEKTIRKANQADENAPPEDDVDQTVEAGPAREVFAVDPLVSNLQWSSAAAHT